MKPLPVGTFVEVSWGKGMSQVCVVERDRPLELREATPFERMRYHFQTVKCKRGELVAACDAIEVINKAKQKASV